MVATVEESVLKTEMEGLESQEEDAPMYGRSDPGDCGEATRDLRLQEISVRPPR